MTFYLLGVRVKPVMLAILVMIIIIIILIIISKFRWYLFNFGRIFFRTNFNAHFNMNMYVTLSSTCFEP